MEQLLSTWHKTQLYEESSNQKSFFGRCSIQHMPTSINDNMMKVRFLLYHETTTLLGKKKYPEVDFHSSKSLLNIEFK